MQVSQKAARKRFYRTAEAVERDGGFAVLLDGRPLKTPAGAAFAVPARGLAEAVAAEWAAQGDILKIESLRLTKLANTAIDNVRGREAEVANDIVGYASSDLVCYRAGFPPELAERQARAWDPVLAWAREALHAQFLTAEGVRHVEQPAASLDAVRAAVFAYGPFQLTALHVMTSLTGSALLALEHARGHLDLAATWRAAHVDEDWQIAQWGEDYEAADRRKSRLSEMEAASRFFHLAAGEAGAGNAVA